LKFANTLGGTVVLTGLTFALLTGRNQTAEASLRGNSIKHWVIAFFLEQSTQTLQNTGSTRHPAQWDNVRSWANTV
jgi:hypothetical protein